MWLILELLAILNQYKPSLSWILAKGPIVACGLRGIWPIIHDEFWQGTASMKSLCFIFTISINLSIVQLCLQELLCFHFPHVYFQHNFVVLQKTPLDSCSLVLYQCQPQWYLPDPDEAGQAREKKTGEKNYFFLKWCIWSWLIWVSVKILMTLFWFQQNASARSCFKGSLMAPTWSYIIL